MEYNILLGPYLPRDKETFFGPLEGSDSFVRMSEHTTLPQLLKAIGIYPSTSAAFRDGYKGDIPYGWLDRDVGALGGVGAAAWRPARGAWVGAG